MRYAIIGVEEAGKLGIKKEYHVLNQKKDMMIINENELNAIGERGADFQAERLGISLMTRAELSTLLNKNKTWIK